jgi:toxin CcdB
VGRFDVYRLGLAQTPFVVDVQSNPLASLKSRVVIPLLPAQDGQSAQELARLKPILAVAGGAYVLMTTDLAAISTAQLGAFVTNIESEHRDAVTTALDFLFFGF